MFGSSYNCEEEVTDPSSHWVLAVVLLSLPASCQALRASSLGADVASSKEGHTLQAALYHSLALLGKPGSELARQLVKPADSEPSPGVSASGLMEVRNPTLNQPSSDPENPRTPRNTSVLQGK